MVSYDRVLEPRWVGKVTCMSAVSLSLPPALARKPFTACMLSGVSGKVRMLPEHAGTQGWLRQSYLQMISARSHCEISAEFEEPLHEAPLRHLF